MSSSLPASIPGIQTELVGSAPAWSRSLVHCKDSSNSSATAVPPNLQDTPMRLDCSELQYGKNDFLFCSPFASSAAGKYLRNIAINVTSGVDKEPADFDARVFAGILAACVSKRSSYVRMGTYNEQSPAFHVAIPQGRFSDLQ
jgi:hypothetical protein